MITQVSKLGALCGVIILVMLVAVPIASAHHPVVVANLSCDGTVTFTVTADTHDSSRDNASVSVVDTSGGSQPIATGVFNSADNWSFSGSFTVPSTVTSDTLTPQALGVWGDGWQPSDGPSTTITRPTTCPTIQATPAATPIPQAVPAPAATPPPAAAPIPQQVPVTAAASPPATPAATQPAPAVPPAASGLTTDVMSHATAPFLPPTPPATPAKTVASPPPASGSTDLESSHVAPFTPPGDVARVKPKLVSHAQPTTAG